MCKLILSVFYVAMILGGRAGIAALHPTITVVGHAAGLGAVWALGRGIDFESNASITGYYMVIWKLFYLEFFVFTLACLYAGSS